MDPLRVAERGAANYATLSFDSVLQDSPGSHQARLYCWDRKSCSLGYLPQRKFV
jgi:hypothetical protein